MGDIMIIGELALHVFIVNDRDKYKEELVQIGGIGYMIRKMYKLGIHVKSIAVCGQDNVGDVFKKELDPICHSIRFEKKKAFTSIVYIDMRNDKPIVSICKENANFKLQPIDVKFDDIVYYPYFVNFVENCEEVINKSNRVIVDFGYYEWVQSATVLLEILNNTPKNGFLALVSGENYSYDDKLKIIDKLSILNFQNIIITAAEKKIMAWIDSQLFEIDVEPVNAVCCIGAGDIFIVGIMIGIKKGMKMLDAIDYGKKLVREKVKKMGI